MSRFPIKIEPLGQNEASFREAKEVENYVNQYVFDRLEKGHASFHEDKKEYSIVIRYVEVNYDTKIDIERIQRMLKGGSYGKLFWVSLEEESTIKEYYSNR